MYRAFQSGWNFALKRYKDSTWNQPEKNLIKVRKVRSIGPALIFSARSMIDLNAAKLSDKYRYLFSAQNSIMATIINSVIPGKEIGRAHV